VDFLLADRFENDGQSLWTLTGVSREYIHVDWRRRRQLDACEAANRRPSERRGAYEKVTPSKCPGHVSLHDVLR
jgi:hypothetical protein